MTYRSYRALPVTDQVALLEVAFDVIERYRNCSLGRGAIADLLLYEALVMLVEEEDGPVYGQDPSELMTTLIINNVEYPLPLGIFDHYRQAALDEVTALEGGTNA